MAPRSKLHLWASRTEGRMDSGLVATEQDAKEALEEEASN